MTEIWSGLKASLQEGRAKTIEVIIIKLKSDEIKTYDVKKLRQIFWGK